MRLVRQSRNRNDTSHDETLLRGPCSPPIAFTLHVQFAGWATSLVATPLPKSTQPPPVYGHQERERSPCRFRPTTRRNLVNHSSH